MSQQQTGPVRLHWWQSIRWRLALGSMLVALLATLLLAGLLAAARDIHGRVMR